MTSGTRATVCTFVVLGTAMSFACAAIESWADHGFADRLLASVLCGGIELGLVAVALCLAPPLSAILRRLLP